MSTSTHRNNPETQANQKIIYSIHGSLTKQQRHDILTNLTQDKQLDWLKTASDFAYKLWQQQPETCQKFIQAYPLIDDLTATDITQLTFAYVYQQQLQILINKQTKNPTSTSHAITTIDPLTAHENYAMTVDESTVMQRLRQLRNLLMLRWIWQDALALISVPELTRQLSNFADSAVLFAKSYSYIHLRERYGEPLCGSSRNPKIDDMAIIAMGKHGACELNLSSDIDLIFVHDNSGQESETSGAEFVSPYSSDTPTRKRKQIENKRFMMLWGQSIIKLLDQNTLDGFVFRVDMRLRPWGEGSDLAIHLSALEKYFNKNARPWERFAWLKARAINQTRFDETLQAIVKPFVFRHYVDYSAFAALREMKGLIQQQVTQRQDEDNIKLGAGGIRDIEFIVQAFQLIYGGKFVQMQVKTCLLAMQELADLDFIEPSTHWSLHTAYLFLRRLEHAIQALQDKQTQRLPQQPEQQARLAKVMGFADWQDLLSHLNDHRHAVQIPFDRMVTLRQQHQDLAINPTQIQQKLEELLTTENQALLDTFWHSNLIAKLSPQARKHLDEAYPVLCLGLVKCKHPNAALPHLVRLLEAISRRSIYLVMLAENPSATEHLVTMLAASPWIASELAQYPVLLDTFLQKRFAELPDKAELSSLLRQQLLRIEIDDEETLLTAIRLFKKDQVLAVAASDVLAQRPLMKVSDTLTHIAEVVLNSALQRVFMQLVSKHGYPINNQGEAVSETDCGFAIVGFGKLGGIELSYSSDLDLVFLHDIDEQHMTNGEKPISGMRFAARLAQKLMTLLSTQTRDGRAYEIDTRLRPSGNAGMLVVSTAGFLHYELEKAWVWEHQALVRSRAICGDNHVMQRFNDIRKQVLTQKRNLSELQTEVKNMRQKMRDHLGSKTADQAQGKFHLKHDAGGIVDIEFMAQFCVLAHAHAHPEITTYSDDVRIYEDLAKVGILTDADSKTLIGCYLHMRAKTHQLALAEQKLLIEAAPWQHTRDQVITFWQRLLN